MELFGFELTTCLQGCRAFNSVDPIGGSVSSGGWQASVRKSCLLCMDYCVCCASVRLDSRVYFSLSSSLSQLYTLLSHKLNLTTIVQLNCSTLNWPFNPSTVHVTLSDRLPLPTISCSARSSPIRARRQVTATIRKPVHILQHLGTSQ